MRKMPGDPLWDVNDRTARDAGEVWSLAVVKILNIQWGGCTGED